MSPYRIVRDDGQLDNIAGQAFSTYDAAYAVLERYYGDLCCSDEREYYREGSEYRAVVTPPAYLHYATLQRNLLDTGITRGKQLGRRRYTKLAKWLSPC